MRKLIDFDQQYKDLRFNKNCTKLCVANHTQPRIMSTSTSTSKKGSSSQNPKTKEEMPLWRNILSLEPGLVLHMTAAIMVFMVVQDFMLEKACRVNLAYGDQVCDALKAKNSGDKYASQEKEVQKLIGGVMVYRTILENAFPIVLVFLIGAWSDKYGRKFPLLVVIGAFFLQNCILLLCVFFDKGTGAWSVAIASSLIASLSGNQACFMVAAFSYVSDNTIVEKRTMRTGITHCCIFLGVTLGLAGGGALSHSGLPFSTSFLIGVGLEFVALAYLGVMMTNQPQPGATKGKSWGQIVAELFDFKHVKDSFSSVMRSRPDGARGKLWLLLVAHACAMLPMMGEMGVSYLFTRLQFNWDGGAFGSWMTYKTVIGFLSNFLSMALLTSALQFSDPATGIVAALGNFIASLIFAFAHTPFLMYLAPLATLLSGGGMVVPRATISKLVPTGELGKVNSFIGSLESIIPLVGSWLYTKTYTSFLDVLPGSFFLISAAVAVPPILIYGWFLSQDKARKDVKKKTK